MSFVNASQQDLYPRERVQSPRILFALRDLNTIETEIMLL